MEVQCLSIGSLRLFLSGKLTKEQEKEMEFHLNSCAPCRQRLLDACEESDSGPEIKPVPEWLVSRVARITESVEKTKPGFFTYRSIAAIAAAAVFLIVGSRFLLNRSQPAVLQPLPGTSAYWIQKYSVLSVQKEPLVVRAERVFHRLNPVMEQETPGKSRLLFVGGEAPPFAVALRDGTIVLSASAIQTCYRDVSMDEGDARLAFVLAHELVHQKKRHYLHAAAFAAVQDQGALPEASPEKEMAADVYGLIIASF